MSLRAAVVALRSRADLALLATLVAGVNLLPQGDPLGIKGFGVVEGAVIALQALGIVLVMRSTRIVNFAQVQVGIFAALLFTEMVRHNEMVLAVQTVCPPCVSTAGANADVGYLQSHSDAYYNLLTAQHHTVWLAVNFWVSLVLALAVGAGISWAVHRLLVSRFADAPRLVATVATIAVAEVLGGFPFGAIFQDGGPAVGALQVPLPRVTVHLPGDGTAFHLGEMLTIAVAVAACAMVVAWLRRSRTGVAIRAAAENAQRAQTLGIRVRSVTGQVWLVAGLLSAAAEVLSAIAGNPPSGRAGFDVAALIPILAAAVFARFVELPTALLAAVFVGVLDQAAFWNFNTSVPFEGVLVVLIVGALFLQRPSTSRAEEEATAAYLAAREARPIPTQLRGVPVVARARVWLLLIGLGAVALLPFLMAPGQVSAMSTVVIEAMVGLSLLVLAGWAGQISLGQFAIAGVGAYVAAMVQAHSGLGIVIAVLAGGLAGTLAAAILGLASLRLRGLQLAVTTLAFALAVSDILLAPDQLGAHLPSTTDRPVLLGIDLSDERAFLYFAIAWLVLAALAVAGMRRGRVARALIACRDNEPAAQSFGLSLLRVRLAAFGLSGFLAAVAGGLFAYHQGGVERVDFLPNASIAIFLLVIVGGLGSLAGPLLGSGYQGLLVLLPAAAAVTLGSGIGVIAVLLLAPGGLGALAYALRDSLLRRVAIRHRIMVPTLLRDAADFDRRRAPIVANRAGRRAAYVAERYRLVGQWAGFRPRMPDA